MSMLRYAFASLASTLALGVATFTLAMPAQAHAGTVDRPATGFVVDYSGDPMAKVAYGDLDLATPGGQALLAQRLERAADAVCRYAGDGQAALQARMAYRNCYQAALTSGQTRMAALVSGAKAG